MKQSELNFNKILDSYIKIYKELKKKNYDWGVLLLGLRRVGKSTLSLYLAYRIWRALNKEVNVYLFLGVVGNIHKIVEEYNMEHSIVIFDELGVTAFSRDHMRREQKNLVKALNIMSIYNNFYIGNIQNIMWMDKILRSTNFWKDAWLLYARGEAVWFSPPMKILARDSIVFLFQNWSTFEKYYEYLRPYNIHEFLEVFHAHKISYSIKINKNEQYINLWNGEEFVKISFEEYDKQRRQLSNILDSNIQNEKELLEILYEQAKQLLLSNKKLKLSKFLYDIQSKYGDDVFIEIVDKLYKLKRSLKKKEALTKL